MFIKECVVNVWCGPGSWEDSEAVLAMGMENERRGLHPSTFRLNLSNVRH